MKKPGVGVVIGRFHVPELSQGHMELMKRAAEHRVFCVVVGVAPVPSVRNPLPFECRRDLIQASYPGAVVLPMMDRESDVEWSYDLDRMLSSVFPGEPIDLYGGRDSFIDRYHGRLNTISIPEWHDSGPSGTEIRADLTVDQSTAFRAGVIYGKTKPGFGQVFSTVDITALYDGNVVMIRKPLEDALRFPGGFVDPTDPSYQEAAAREFKEECGAELVMAECISPSGCQVNDWRYQGTGSSIMTMVYYGAAMTEPHPGDDACEVELVAPGRVMEIVAPVHAPIARLLSDYMKGVSF